MIRIAVCDSDEAACYRERDCLQNVLSNFGIEYKIDLFFDTERLYRSLHDRLYDLLLTDVCVCGADMLEFTAKLREEAYPIRVIFVSDGDIDLSRAFDVFALSCFRKPLTEEKLSRVLSYVSCLNILHRHINVSAKNGEKYRIYENDILYIEVFHNDICIHLSGREIICRSTLSAFLEQLSSAAFIRCHQSYAVNLGYAVSMRRYTVSLSDGSLVPISKSRYMFVRDSFLAMTRKT